MAGWSGLSAVARGAVLLGGAAVVAVAGYFGFARGPEAVIPAADQAAVTGAEVPAAGAGTEGAAGDAPPAEVSPAQTAVVAPVAGVDADSAAVAADDPTAAETAAAPAILPRFDVTRIAPDGAATVAGQAAPGATVALLVDGVEVAKAVADGQGKFAALFDVPPSPVARLLSLQATGADGVAVAGTETVALAPVVGAAEVAVAGAVEPTMQAPAAVLIAPEGVKVLQPGAEVPDEVAANVMVESISYAPDGAVMLGGRAGAGAGVRVYLDGLAIADVAAGPDGAWAATLKDVAAGIYTLRVDQLAADGTVTSRFETPFKRETLEALAAASGPAVQPEVSAEAAPVVAEASSPAAPQPLAEAAPAANTTTADAATEVAEAEVAADDAAPAPETTAADAAPVVEAAPADAAAAIPDAAPVPESGSAATAPVVDAAGVTAEPAALAPAAVAVAKPAPVSVTVQPGYTLWGIAQQNFGDGVMYVQVFEANKDKIKDPDLIYPGQVFTIPAAP